MSTVDRERTGAKPLTTYFVASVDSTVIPLQESNGGASDYCRGHHAVMHALIIYWPNRVEVGTAELWFRADKENLGGTESCRKER